MRPLQRTLRKQHPIIPHHPHGLPVQLRVTAHQSLPILFLELAKLGPIKNSGDHFTHIKRLLQIVICYGVEVLGVVFRGLVGGVEEVFRLGV